MFCLPELSCCVVLQTVDGTYNLNDYLQAVINAGAFMQSNGTRVKSPGLGYESASGTSTKPTFDGCGASLPMPITFSNAHNILRPKLLL